MTDDRARDAYLAERLFGWTNIKADSWFGNRWYGLGGLPPDGDRYEGVPPYSTTWEGAGRVLAGMGELGYRLVLLVAPDGVTTAGFWLERDPSVATHPVTDSDATQAITQAVVAALERKEDETDGE